MDTTVSLDGGHLSEHLHRVGLGSHAKLERQGSKGSKGCSTPSRKAQSPLGHRADTEKQHDDLQGMLSIVSSRKEIKSQSDCYLVESLLFLS